jgi:hypothetical protein
MKRFFFIATCSVALIVPVAVLASGGDAGFDGVVSSIESQYHVHATRIPFLAFVSFMARRSTHAGVSNLHVAEFEHFAAAVDGDDLNSLVTEKLGSGWERMIRETSRRKGCDSASMSADPCSSGGEQTLIFTRPEGNRMGMFILDLDGGDMDVVQLSVDPDHLNENLNHYEHHHDGSDHDSGDVSN